MCGVGMRVLAVLPYSRQVRLVRVVLQIKPDVDYGGIEHVLRGGRVHTLAVLPRAGAMQFDQLQLRYDAEQRQLLHCLGVHPVAVLRSGPHVLLAHLRDVRDDAQGRFDPVHVGGVQ